MNTVDMPANPVELAELRAQQSFSSSNNDFTMAPADQRLLAELDFAADELGFIGQSYFVQAARGLVIPKSFDASEDLTYTSITDVMLEGSFATFSKVHVGKIIGHGTVRAVCLAFDGALLVPQFVRVDPDELLFVPVLAVDTILASN